ncbi:MAG: SAM-dependent methyltransferase [Nitrospirae bacterium]|nr:SAM-dependent methyltransferase [Nitrospirota bacterium]
MNPLEQKIAERIRREGPITFESFMAMALYDPEFGYYVSRGQRIGREGDFYTSSHLHPVFGAMIGKQIREMWECIGSPEGFTIIEMGAGEGYVCKDMLDYLARLGSEEQGTGGGFFQTLRYVIVERNELQRKRQQELLSIYKEKIAWISAVREAGTIRGCIFSNELLDAFPVHLLRMEGRLKEVYLSHDGTSFHEQTGELSTDDIDNYFSDTGIAIETGYTTEVNLRIRGWLQDISAVLEKGFVFTIDYGHPAEEYYSDDRNRGTLLCYHNHEVSEDPYIHIGDQDMTSHVNFSSVRRWGEEAGLKPLGYCSQGAFFLAMGIDQEIAKLAETSADYLIELSRIKTLFLPQGMGESHKVLIQYKGDGTPALRAFSIRNQLRFL